MMRKLVYIFTLNNLKAQKNVLHPTMSKALISLVISFLTNILLKGNMMLTARSERESEISATLTDICRNGLRNMTKTVRLLPVEIIRWQKYEEQKEQPYPEIVSSSALIACNAMN